MAVNAHITLTGRQKDETGEVAVTEHSGDAEYFEKNGSCYIFYDNTPDGANTPEKADFPNGANTSDGVNSPDGVDTSNRVNTSNGVDTSNGVNTSNVMGTIVKSTIKLKNSVLELSQRGVINTRMVFEPGKEYITDYATPYGCLKMGITTHSLDVFRTERTLKIRIKYALTSEGLPVSECSMDITVRPNSQAFPSEPADITSGSKEAQKEAKNPERG